MSYKFADRVKEFTTTTGTGAVALGGAASGYRGFGAVLTDGDTCGYCIADPNTGEWEVGTGTYTAPSTLTRTTVLSGTNGTSPVDFAAGSKDVMLVLTSAKMNEFMISPMTTLGDLIIAGAGGAATRLPAITGLVKGTGSSYEAAAATDITGALITGFSSGAGTVTSTDTILQAINKLNGNIAAKQDTLVSGTNIKTIGGASLVGSGDIPVGAGDVTLNGTQTLTNKTLTAPALNDPVVNGPVYTRDDDGTISGGTWAIDYANGPVIKATAGANITSITMSNWPASGTAGHLKLMLVNFGAYTITFPAAWNWVKSDLTTTTTFSGLGVTLPSSGACFVDLISIDGGTTIYAYLAR